MVSYLSPEFGYSGVEHVIESILEILGHDDGTLYSQFEISQCVTYSSDYSLHSVDFLLQENVQRFEMIHLSQTISDL